VVLAIDELADEGACVYFGDTNHAHALREAADAYNEWRILDSLPGVDICRHGHRANGSCPLCYQEQANDD
jgi:hypothetical protein